MSKDTVTVIKSVNYSEADKILTVFGKYNGKFSIMAKGIRKITSKNRGNMQTLSTSEISYYEGKGLPILTESQLISAPDIDSHINIDNIQRLLYLLNKFLAEGEHNQKIFNLLQLILVEDLTTVRINKFRLRVLKELGFLSDFDMCSICHSKNDLQYFNPNDFSVLCSKCYSTKSKGVKLDKDIYSNTVFTASLDRYIKKIVEEI